MPMFVAAMEEQIVISKQVCKFFPLETIGYFYNISKSVKRYETYITLSVLFNLGLLMHLKVK